MTELTCANCGGSGLVFMDPEGNDYHRCCMGRSIAERVALTLPIEQREGFIEGWKEDMRIMHYAK